MSYAYAYIRSNTLLHIYEICKKHFGFVTIEGYQKYIRFTDKIKSHVFK